MCFIKHIYGLFVIYLRYKNNDKYYHKHIINLKNYNYEYF